MRRLTPVPVREVTWETTFVTERALKTINIGPMPEEKPAIEMDLPCLVDVNCDCMPVRLNTHGILGIPLAHVPKSS